MLVIIVTAYLVPLLRRLAFNVFPYASTCATGIFIESKYTNEYLCINVIQRFVDIARISYYSVKYADNVSF